MLTKQHSIKAIQILSLTLAMRRAIANDLNLNIDNLIIILLVTLAYLYDFKADVKKNQRCRTRHCKFKPSN